jgi:hypothetical protein
VIRKFGWLFFEFEHFYNLRSSTSFEADSQTKTTSTGATPTASARTEPTKGPKLSEVVAYAKDKFGDDSRHLNWSASFHRYWADPKRNWKRADKTIDWQIEFSKQAANWRTQP